MRRISVVKYCVKANGKYHIQRKIHGKLNHYGYYNTLEETEKYISLLDKIKWDKELFDAFKLLLKLNSKNFDKKRLLEIYDWWQNI